MELFEKVVSDTLHGQVSLPPLAWRLIDTPEFQRLRHIKQLGFVSYVYPGAVHTRFEHCIGTAHLANKLVCSLHEYQPWLNITESDILCVTLAGLLHDIGHGPFSHTFERFVKKYQAVDHSSTEQSATPSREKIVKFEHEHFSLALIELLIDNVAATNQEQLKRILNELANRGVSFDAWIGRNDNLRRNPESKDLQFIKDLVDPPKQIGKNDWRKEEDRYLKKKFLFEIVSNKWSGLDVDKLDYFARDALFTGMRSAVNHERYIRMARVVPYLRNKEDVQWCSCPPGSLENPGDDCFCNSCHGVQRHICLPLKEDSSVFDIFQARYALFKRVYLHKVVVGVELTFLDIMLHAASKIKYSDGEGHWITLKSCLIDCMDQDPSIRKKALKVYLQLTDEVIHLIKSKISTQSDMVQDFDSDEELGKASKLLSRVEQRTHYRFIDECLIDTEKLKVQSKVIENVIAEIKIALTNKNIDEKDFIIEKTILDFGYKEINPFDRVLFFNKLNLDIYMKIPASRMVALIAPKIKNEQLSHIFLRLYYRGTPAPENSLVDFQDRMRQRADIFKEATKPYTMSI